MKERKDVDIYGLLKEEKDMKLKGRLYHHLQIKMCYNSNKIEGSQLTEDQTRYIFETNTIATEKFKAANVDDIIEAVNHFACFDYMLDTAKLPLSEEMIKEYHRILKSGTSDSRKEWFNVGAYKKLENTVGNADTVKPENVEKEIKKQLQVYGKKEMAGVHDIVDFHYRFEKIHPFQDGNGRVGRLIAFKECLKNDVVPFIIQDEFKQYYYRGLQEYAKTPEYLRDTCLHGQDVVKETLLKFLEYDGTAPYGQRDSAAQFPPRKG